MTSGRNPSSEHPLNDIVGDESLCCEQGSLYRNRDTQTMHGRLATSDVTKAEVVGSA